MHVISRQRVCGQLSELSMIWKKKRIWGDPNYEEERNSRTNKEDNVRVVKGERMREQES